ncbi:16291_t:CDS:2 [Cetraspora pellucida]|uniref:16291_t:CDS:1 n=1 Tax=Cetraspora pellucida TaxID=1433469 RepID=A0A9N9IN54_9GLOM|nr:16291_t:CDS:2 [Cetraspora pellucida]
MLRGLKRSFMSEGQGENAEYFGGYGSEEFIIRKSNEEMAILSMGKNSKKMRLNLDQDASRDSVYHNSNSESSPVTPSSYSTYTDTTDNFFAISHQKQLLQKSQQYAINTPANKQRQYPLRISTRSDTSLVSDAELLNPYANINSVLYLANLTRNSHILNEIREDLGGMDIDERENEFGGGVIENSITNLNENLGVNMSVIHPSLNVMGHCPNGVEDINKHDNHGIRDNKQDFGMASGYQSINAILREAFLRRHGLNSQS